MKKSFSFLFLLIVSICTISFMKVEGEQLPLIGKTIYLDAGHGGIDSGAKYKNILEKDINLEIVKILALKLEALGGTVYLTRYGDYDLSNIGASQRKRSDLYNRAKIINESDADIYVSIHLNSTASSTWHGAQVFYDDVCEENLIIANTLSKSLKTRRKVTEISNMYFNRMVKKPGVLVEVGFLSNGGDRQKLLTKEYQEQVADMLVEGIIEYFTS